MLLSARKLLEFPESQENGCYQKVKYKVAFDRKPYFLPPWTCLNFRYVNLLLSRNIKLLQMTSTLTFAC